MNLPTFQRGWRFLILLAFAAGGGPAAHAAPAGEAEPRIVRVGVLTDNFPFSFRDEHGELRGFVYDLTGEIEGVMGLHFERVVGTTAEINDGLRAGRLDLLQSYAQFPERESYADFSVPYLTMAGAIFAGPELSWVRRLEDLRGRRVVVHRGSMGEAVLRRAGLDREIVYAPSVEQTLIEVDAGRADATLVTRLSGLAAAQHLGLKRIRVVNATVPGYEVRYCYGVREGDRKLLAQVNEGLAILVRLGTFDRIYHRWFGHVEPVHYSALQITLAIAVGLAVALAVTGWAMVRQKRLQSRIERQAAVLRASEERLRMVFDGERNGLLVLRVTGEACVVDQINPAARRMAGGQPAGGPPAELARWLPAEPVLVAKLAALVARREPAEFEHEAATGAVWRLTLTPLGEGALLRWRDVTEIVRQRQRDQEREEQLRNAQRLEAIGTLAGGVAHDFNNLLTVIMGNADLCLMNLPASSDEADQVRRILEAARRGRQLVRQVLTFSKRTEPTRERLEVGPVIVEMLGFLRTIARDTVEIEHQRAAALPEIVADPAQLHQVLMNVGTNAVQAMRGGRGRLTVSEEEVVAGEEVRAQHPQLAAGRYVRIGIRDTGPGMPPEVQARIFEPYFTTKSAGGGTGLGLSVAHGIMQRHGGAITVYSQPGRGTLFHLYFPVAAVDGVEGIAELPGAWRGAGEHVLLVDDDPAVGRTAQRILERLGYRVTRHESPAAALGEFNREGHSVRLVITDLTMPEMSGLELVARLRREHGDLPVVVMSGFFAAAEEAALAAAGVQHRLNKPLTYVAMGRTVAAALRRQALEELG